MSYSRAQLRRTGRFGLVTSVLGLALAAGVASPAMAAGNGNGSGPLDKPQPLSNADKNPGGANGQCPGGPYCSTRDGSPSLNGSGAGTAKGKPCAGCVGKADNKNPKGQMPNGSDRNAGYECDRNNGIGKGNPAHTGCTSPGTPPPVKPPHGNPPVKPPHGNPPVKPPHGNPPVKPPHGNPPVKPPHGTPPVMPPHGTPPAVTPPHGTTPAVTPPVLTPVSLVEQPSVLGAVAEAPAVPATNPLPTSAAAGQASTGGQIVAATGAAFAALLALGAGFVLRRRNGVA